MNLKEIGDSFFCDQLKEFVDKSPYMSFVLLSAILEFMGTCYRKGKGSKEDTKDIFSDLINNVGALKEYRAFKDNNKDYNYLYKYLRCGMLHEMIPKKEIELCSNRNNLSKHIIGAKELYEDMQKAWNELKFSPDVSKYIESTDALTVFDEYSGSTTSSVAVISGVSLTNGSEKNIDEEWIAATET